jgi:hypothetical protein
MPLALRLRTSTRTRATLTLLTQRNIGIPTTHQEPLRLRSIQPIMHSLITTTLHLLLTTLNVRPISRLSTISRNLPQQILSALTRQPLQHRTRLIILTQARLIGSHQSHLLAPLPKYLARQQQRASLDIYIHSHSARRTTTTNGSPRSDTRDVSRSGGRPSQATRGT